MSDPVLYRFDGGTYDAAMRVFATANGREFQLTPLEGKAMAFLLAKGKGGARRGDLKAAVWGTLPSGEPPSGVSDASLATLISGLRQKLEDREPWVYIRTVPHVGFRFVPDVTTPGESAGSTRAEKAITPVNMAERHDLAGEQQSQSDKGVLPPRPTAAFLGRTADLTTVWRHLREPQSTTTVPLTVVHGVPGVGKTTLSQAIAHDPSVQATFPDGVLWTSLAQSPNIVSLMAPWVRYLEGDERSAQTFLGLPTTESARREMSRLLGRRRMLLIVDDVWAANDLTAFVQCASEGCAVLATTRQPAVWQALASEAAAPVQLPPLSPHDAFALLERLAPTATKDNPEPCRRLLRSIGHLPLAIHVAGRLLSEDGQLGIDDVVSGITQERIIGGSVPPIMGTTENVERLFAKSTDLLDPPVRGRLRILGGYSKSTTLSLPLLARLWEVDDPLPTARELVRHGLLEPRGGGKFTIHQLIAAHARTLRS